MKNFIILVCFFSIVGVAFALPLTYSTLQSKSATISNEKVDYSGTIEHVFTHCLLAYPALALSNDNSMQKNFDKDCITPNEFKLILKELYNNDYALIDINKIYEEKDGKIIKSNIKVPKGKKPLVLSFDDVNYDQKKMKKGMVDKIIVDENGNLASQTEITWSTKPTTEISYDNEFVPILENFVKLHPDFSIDGAKGTICLTGYDGILGYRTSSKNTNNRQQEINSAKIVVDKLKENGWNFACHSFGHYHMTKLSDEEFKKELESWENEVTPIIGETNVYVYPYGEWELINANGIQTKKHKMLLDFGFKLFCGVGVKPFFSYLPYTSSSSKTLFMDRTPLDGETLRNQKDNLSRLFNTETVYDYKYRPIKEF